MVHNYMSHNYMGYHVIGPDYLDHCYTGHHNIGHEYTDHIYISHDCIGHSSEVRAPVSEHRFGFGFWSYKLGVKSELTVCKLVTRLQNARVGRHGDELNGAYHRRNRASASATTCRRRARC